MLLFKETKRHSSFKEQKNLAITKIYSYENSLYRNKNYDRLVILFAKDLPYLIKFHVQKNYPSISVTDRHSCDWPTHHVRDSQKYQPYFRLLLLIIKLIKAKKT